MTINLTALQKQRRDTAANWTGANPTLLAGEIGIESDTNKIKIGDGSTAWTSLAYIPGLAYGTARQLLQTNSGATGAEWTSNVDIPGTLDVTGTSTLDGMVLVGLTSSIGGGKLQLSTDTATAIQSFTFSSTADTSTSTLQLVRARGTKASPSVLLNNDYIGEIRFIGYGTTYNTGATIRAVVDGEPATSGDTTDMPTKLVFLTSPNGSATPDTRMTIDSAGLVTIPGDLTVNGTTTTINSTTLVVQDKNIEMGVVATPTDVTADGGGITLKGTTDKTINWIDATDAWTFSEHVNIASAKEYRIAGTKVLDATSLGSAVVGSSLTSVGTIGTGVWQGTAIADTYLGTISTALKVSNSATTATNANTASAIVARDASGNFTAGTITAALTGNASTVTTNANLTGDVTSVGNATSIAAGVIVDADINASAAIAGTKISPDFGAQTIVTTGVHSAALGAAATPSITFTGDLNTGIYSPGADTLAFVEGGAEAMRIDSSSRLLIGTSSSNSVFYNGAAIGDWRPLLQVARLSQDAVASFSIWNSTANTYTSYGGAQLHLSACKSGTVGSHASGALASGDTVGSITFSPSDGTNFNNCARIEAVVDGGVSTGDVPGRLVFSTCPDSGSSPTEAMRINNAGRVMIGGTTATAGSQPVFFQVGESADFFHIERSGASSVIEVTMSCSTTTNRNFIVFKNPNGSVGSISVSASATAYNTSSDYRLKENVTAVIDGITRLQQLKPSRFNFIADTDKTVDGFIAHEAQAVVPECVTGTKDEVDADGNPVYQGIDQSKLVPLLTAALQEAIAKIESLEARLTAAGI